MKKRIWKIVLSITMLFFVTVPTEATTISVPKRENQEAKSIYQSLDHRKKELKKQHITEEEVDAVVSTEGPLQRKALCTICKYFS